MIMAVANSAPQKKSSPLALSCLILCGGKSKRMGRNKAFLPYSGTTLLEHIVETARGVFDEVLLVTNESEMFADLGVDTVKDILPHRGPLGGILSGLLVASNQRSFVLPCDTPFIDRALLRAISRRCHKSDVYVLAHKQGIEPLVGVYSKSCIKPLEEALFAGDPGLHDFISGLNADTFDYDSAPERKNTNGLPAYFSVDTPADYCMVVAGGSQEALASVVVYPEDSALMPT
jgi:molybdopterin-guanine dinucleotide biosynthesis protein A